MGEVPAVRNDLLETLRRKENKSKSFSNPLSLKSGLLRPFSSTLEKLSFGVFNYVTYKLAQYGITFGRSPQISLFTGDKLYVPLNEAGGRELFLFGYLRHPTELKLTKYLIRRLTQNDVFYDIGASFGFYSFLASSFVPDERVHLFEPNQRIAPFLTRTFSRGDRNFHFNEIAVSDESGTVEFFDVIGANRQSTMVADVARIVSESERVERREVSSVTLDEYVGEHEDPTILKIDVEGAEKRVLEGGKRTITEKKPVVITEVWARSRRKIFDTDVIKILDQQDYQPFLIDSRGKLKETSSDRILDDIPTRRGLENVVFLPESEAGGSVNDSATRGQHKSRESVPNRRT